MPSKKKIKVEEKALPPPARKTYFLIAPDAIHSAATYTEGKVIIAHNEDSYVSVIDTGNGYHISDTSRVNGTVTYDLDYALAADFFAALKIIYHNSSRLNGEYWTVFQGEKL